jgi:hypothetical protein
MLILPKASFNLTFNTYYQTEREASIQTSTSWPAQTVNTHARRAQRFRFPYLPGTGRCGAALCCCALQPNC